MLRKKRYNVAPNWPHLKKWHQNGTLKGPVLQMAKRLPKGAVLVPLIFWVHDSLFTRLTDRHYFYCQMQKKSVDLVFCTIFATILVCRYCPCCATHKTNLHSPDRLCEWKRNSILSLLHWLYNSTQKLSWSCFYSILINLDVPVSYCLWCAPDHFFGTV